jgi:hypothetical protein
MRKLLTFLFALAAIGVCSPVQAQFVTLGAQGCSGAGCGGGGGGRTCTDDTASTNFLTRTGGSSPNYGAGSARYADAYCVFIKALESPASSREISAV